MRTVSRFYLKPFELLQVTYESEYNSWFGHGQIRHRINCNVILAVCDFMSKVVWLWNNIAKIISTELFMLLFCPNLAPIKI